MDCKYKASERPVLYVMVFIILTLSMSHCDSVVKIDRIEKQLERIELKCQK